MVDIAKISSKDQGYMERAERIIELYNQSSIKPFDESLNLRKPETTIIIYADSDTGGLLLDHDHSLDIYRVMFAAFDEENRGKGLLKSCLRFAERENIDVAMVDVDGDKEHAVWKKLGYTILGQCNFSIVATNRKLSCVNYDSPIVLM